jgi:hypothetical protein
MLFAGGLILAYGIFSLRAGWVISTWARIEYRPSAIYWITVIALIGIGGVNVALGLKSFIWPARSGTESKAQTHPKHSPTSATKHVE